MRADMTSVPAYLSAFSPYSVNEMFVNTNELEYFAEDKVIQGYVEDKFPQREYYKYGYSIFWHEIFGDRNDHYYQRIRDAGKIAFCQFTDAMWEAFRDLASYYESFPFHYGKPSMQIYLDAAAKYIRVLKQTHYASESGVIWGERGVGSWEYILTGPFEAAGIVKSFKIEKKKTNPDKELLHLFRLVKWRMDAGWWNNGNYQDVYEKV